MLTVVESPIFQRLWPQYWDEDGGLEFASFIAANPDAGSVIRGSVASARCAGRVKAWASPVACASSTSSGMKRGGVSAHPLRQVQVSEHFSQHTQGRFAVPSKSKKLSAADLSPSKPSATSGPRSFSPSKDMKAGKGRSCFPLPPRPAGHRPVAVPVRHLAGRVRAYAQGWGKAASSPAVLRARCYAIARSIPRRCWLCLQ